MNYTLGLQLTADKSGLSAAVVNASGDLRNLGNAGRGAGESINTGMRNAQTGAEKLEKQVSTLKAQFLGFFAASKAVDVLRGAGRMADEYANLSARLKGAIGDSVNFEQAQQRVFLVAQQTSTSLAVTTALTAKLTKALREMGETSASAFEQSLGLATTINQAFAVSGTTAENANAAIAQLNQAFNKGVLNGDEFVSVFENAPGIVEALRISLGKTTGELRAMSEAGLLTSQVIITALQGQASAISAQFAKLPLTIGRAWQQLENSVLQYVGQADQANGASQTLAGSLKFVADNLGAIANAVVALTVAGIATLFARGVSSVASYTQGLMKNVAANSALSEMTLLAAQAKVRDTQATLTQTEALVAANVVEAERALALLNASRLEVLRAQKMELAAKAAGAQSFALKIAAEADLRYSFALGARDIAEKKLAATTAASTALKQTATAATLELAAAQTAANLAATAGPGLFARLGSGLLAFVGGPVGAAILGLTALVAIWPMLKSEAVKASEATTAAIVRETEANNALIVSLNDKRRALIGSTPDNLSPVENRRKEIAAIEADIAAAELRLLQTNGYGALAYAASLAAMKYQVSQAKFELNALEKSADGAEQAQRKLTAAERVLAGESVNLSRVVDQGAASWGNYKIAIGQASGATDLQKRVTDELKRSEDNLRNSQALAAGKNPAIEKLKLEIAEAERAANPLAAALKEVLAQIIANDAGAKAATDSLNTFKGGLAAGESQAKKSATALGELKRLAQDLSASFNGPDKQANERYADQMERIGELFRAAGSSAAALKIATDALTSADLEHTAAMIAVESAENDKVKALEADIAATKAADEAVRNYTGSAQEELKLIGLSTAERKIQEAGLKAETELRDRITEALKHQGSAYEAMGVVAREVLIQQEGDAERAAQTQILISESAKHAADEYERNWQSALDAVASDFVKGGKNIGDIARRFLQDLAAQYAKKIFLDIVTRYTSQGEPGKPGQEGSTTAGAPGGIVQTGFTFLAGASGVRDAYRTGGGLGGAAAGALAGAQAGSAILPGIGTIIGGIIGAIAGFFGGPSEPDLRLGAAGSTRKPEQTFQTEFGAQQIGVRGGTSTEEFTKLLVEFDKTLSGIVGNFQNGQAQLDAVKQRLSTWSVDLKGAAITTEAVLGSRFAAILSTFNADIQTFVGTTGTIAERAQRLQDAAFIEAAASGGALMTTFNGLATVLKQNAIAGETVQQTYDRISQAAETLTAALGLSGLNLDLTREEFIKFAADIQTAAGGTREAATLWQTYFDTFYTATESAQTRLDQAQATRNASLTELGLAANISVQEYRARFEAALPTLSAEDVVRWLQAGAAISNANAAQAAYTATLAESTQALIDEQKAKEEALLAAIGSLSDIESQINEGFTTLARSGLSSFQAGLYQINDTMLQTVASLNAQRRAAVLAGASAEQLARFDLALGRAQMLAAAQSAAALNQLRDAGRSLVAQLGIGLGEPTNAAQTFADAGVNAFNQIGEAASNVYESQLSALQSIQEWLDAQRLGNLSSLTPAERFDEANAQFNAAFAAAQGGDPEALRRLTSLADALLAEGRARFASSQGFTDLEARIRAALQGLVNAGPTATQTQGTGGSQTASAINGLGDQLGTQTAQNRTELLAQLSQIVRDLIAATGGSLSAVAASLSLDLSAFVTQLGGATVETLGNVAAQLGIEATEVAAAVGATLGQLGDRQSLLNDSVELAISLLPEGQRAALQPLLDQVEASADDPEGLRVAREALVNRILKIGGEAADALAPFFDEIDPVDTLIGIDGVLRAGFGDLLLAIDSVTGAINGVGSFDVGTSYVSRNGLAQIHEGEMVIDPASSAALRRYGVQVQPVGVSGGDSQGTLDRLDRIERVLERGFGSVAGAVVDRSERQIRSAEGGTDRILREAEFSRASKRRSAA